MRQLRAYPRLSQGPVLFRQAVTPDRDPFLRLQMLSCQGTGNGNGRLQQTIRPDHGIRVQVQQDLHLRILGCFEKIYLPCIGACGLLPVDGTVRISRLIIPKPPEGQRVLHETAPGCHLSHPSPGQSCEFLYIYLLREHIDTDLLLPGHGKQPRHEEIPHHDIRRFHTKMSPLRPTEGQSPPDPLMPQYGEHIISVIIIRYHGILHIPEPESTIH